MFYYSIEASMTNMKEIENHSERRSYGMEHRIKFDELYAISHKKIYMFISSMRETKITLGCITVEKDELEKYLPKFWKLNNLEVKDITHKEITLNTLSGLLNISSRNGYIEDSEDVLSMFKLFTISYSHHLNYNEDIYDGASTKDELLEQARQIMCENSIAPELDRIFLGAKVKVKGHPVHYLVESDDVVIREKMVQILHSALYSVGRLESRRCTTVTFFEVEHFSKQQLDELYNSCCGGMVYLKLLLGEEDATEVKKIDAGFIVAICEIMKKYKNSVLTVFGICRTSKKAKEPVYENLGNTCIVEFDEEIIFGDKAKDYLKTLAKNAGVKGNKKLYNCVKNADKGHLASDLNKEFDYWYNNILKTEIYPQYAQVHAVNVTAVKKVKGSAYAELQKMIGLTEAKKVIDKALNFYKAQRLFRQKGMSQDTPSMHMMFTGNPGTAKTSVARLFSEIMKENGLLSHGDLFEVGRGDIVGKYVGWTATIIKEKFKAAKGSVLFIDEAYSLVDDRAGLFGDEAINTIVQEMENNRDDIVVIFAGYPDKMKEFLDRNPGLKSRIAFNVHFDDYNSDELMSIANLMAENNGLTISKGAKDKLKDLFKAVTQEENFGNGRYVRNIIEQARMTQAERLIKMDFESVTQNDLTTLIDQDIDIAHPSTPDNKKLNKIGFTN